VAVSAGRKVSWDVVRAGCVTCVMLYHATSRSVLVHPELRPRTVVFPYQVGASLLLVISAYFACVTIGRATPLRYWWGRIARLLPSFLAAVLVIFVVLRAFPMPGYLWPTRADLEANLLMLWNWDPQRYRYIDGSHWTIPLQLLGFTVAATLYRGRWGHGWRLRAVLWLALVVPVVQWPVRASAPPELYRMVADGFGLHRWHLFVAGVAIWLWSTRRLSGGHFAALLAGCMASHALHYSAFTPDGLVTDWGSTVAGWVGLGVLAVVARGPDWDGVVPALVRRPIRWLAGVSYGVFLMHQAIGYVVLRWLQDHGVSTTGQTVGMLVTGIVLGWAMTGMVERPAHQTLMDAYDRVVLAVARVEAAGGSSWWRRGERPSEPRVRRATPREARSPGPA
jgi:peptidoglycan/LPS O-acetylase OafA/YrhL